MRTEHGLNCIGGSRWYPRTDEKRGRTETEKEGDKERGECGSERKFRDVRVIIFEDTKN